MIPAGVTLFTWVDVEEVLLLAHDNRAWPDGLIEAHCYWDELLLSVGSEADATRSVISWIEQQFAPRFRPDPLAIELESMDQAAPRLLPIRIEVAEEGETLCRTRPSFARPRRLCRPDETARPPAPLPAGAPPVVVFHSFKGGVGRTTHAIGFALRAAERSHRPVLLIDGDFEAPGITWHVRDDSRVSIAYADLLALVHSDPSPEATQALDLTARKLLTQRFGHLFVMPAFRSPGHWSTLEVPPNLLQDRSPNDPYQLTELLARLGATIKAAAVVVDLRAGLSELSAGLLLDPRVARVIVTTLSSQSVEGTKELLRRLGRVTATDGASPAPTSSLVINSVPPDLDPSPKLEDAVTALLDAGRDYFSIGDNDVEPSLATFLFSSALLALPTPWDEAIQRIEKAGIPECLTKIVEELLPPVESAPVAETTASDLASKRQELANFAAKVEYAESGAVEKFLRIRALTNLARDFRSTLPLAVVIGAKGSGKTYTFLQMVRVGYWGRFVTEAGDQEPAPRQGELFARLPFPGVDVSQTCVVPALLPANLQQTATVWATNAEEECVRALEFAHPMQMVELRDRAKARLRLPSAEVGSWMNWWLDVIAWRCGFSPNIADAGFAFVKDLARTEKSVLAVIDGLEDLFQEIHSSQVQQEALRALLQDVPEWLRQAAGGRVGLLVFLRSDLVRAAIPQNTGQFLAKHEAYHLRWDEEEALRLAAWTASTSGAIGPPRQSLDTMGIGDLTEYLERLWGTKMGSSSSKEAWSYRWVLAALSDFRGQLQARDMVRLIAEAARGSSEMAGESHSDRLLAPTALKNALRACGNKKIEELEQEAPPLRSIFGKIRGTSDADRQTPFLEGAFGLTSDEIGLLDAQGLVTRDGREYYVPELVRLGLGIGLSRRGRPRMLALRRYGRSRDGAV